MNTKMCCVCKITKAVSEFHHDKYIKDGYRCSCKECFKRRYYSKDYSREGMRKWRSANPDKRNEYRHRRRRMVLARLGGKCACCGEDRFEFLAIDHIHGVDKAQGRKTGEDLVLQVERDGFDRSKYRVLCHNCNCALGFYGYCPHQVTK